MQEVMSRDLDVLQHVVISGDDDVKLLYVRPSRLRGPIFIWRGRLERVMTHEARNTVLARTL